MPTNHHDEARSLEEVVERLVARFADLPPETVRDIVKGSWDEFNGTPIRDFVPVLVERAARQRLSSA
ncbi:MAG: hypothetical protein ABJD68_10015 [Nakamurella sp.]